MGDRKVNREDIALLREVQRNAEMGIHALEQVSPKVYDDSLALHLTRESFQYGALRDRARAQLLAADQTPAPENKVSRLMLTASIQGNTLFNSTTSHLAEMMIRGSSMGLSELWKVMNRSENAGDTSTELARELMDFEEANIKELKKYL